MAQDGGIAVTELERIYLTAAAGSDLQTNAVIGLSAVQFANVCNTSLALMLNRGDLASLTLLVRGMLGLNAQCRPVAWAALATLALARWAHEGCRYGCGAWWIVVVFIQCLVYIGAYSRCRVVSVCYFSACVAHGHLGSRRSSF